MFKLLEVEAVFVVLVQHDLKHVVEELVFFVGFSYCRPWLEIGPLVDLIGLS